MTTTTDSSGQTTQLRTRPEGGGDHESASLSRGLGEVGGSMLKLSLIVAIVLLIEKGISLVNKRQVKLAQN
jgi:hypothetical protein